MNSTRHRLRNPRLWQVSEIEKLAIYYQLPTSACSRLQETLSFFDQLPNAERRQIEKMCQLKTGRLPRQIDTHSYVTDIEKLHQGLNKWINC